MVALLCNSYLRDTTSSFVIFLYLVTLSSSWIVYPMGLSTLALSKTAITRRALAVSYSRLFATQSSTVGQTIQSLLICGPSGVGKGTLITRLLEEYPHNVALSVSRTSRAPRAGEVHGIHYYFIPREELAADISQGKIPYLESAEVHGNLYGTRLDVVEAIHKQYKICLLDLDTHGAQQLQSKQFPMHSIFIAPPSIDDLEKRLLQRGSETIEQRTLRLRNAQKEIEYGTKPGNFECILINDNLEQTYRQLIHQLQLWFPTYFQIGRAHV